MNNPILSIIIPNYGDARISNILDYFANEDKSFFGRTELIIVEGNLKNPQKNIYKKYNYLISNLIIEEDSGIFDALNKGISVSNGKYIFLIGSDDTFSSPGIIKLFFNSIGDEDIYGVNCYHINSNGKKIRKWVNRENNRRLIKLGFLPPHFSIFINKHYYKSIGLFKTEMGDLGLDSIWLYELRNFNFKYKFLGSDIKTIIEQGGASNNSLKNIFKGNWVFFKHVCKNENIFAGILVIFIKLGSKIFQY